MKVAFITRFHVIETKGGTERITGSVADILSRQYGVKCYSLYFNEISNKGSLKPNDVFAEEAKIDNLNRSESIKKHILKWGIDIVVSQNEFEVAINLSKAKIPNLKIVFVHHFRPGSEILALECRGQLRRLFHGNRNDQTMALKKIMLTPYLCFKKYRFPKLYRNVYDHTDQLILLSRGFIKPFSDYARKNLAPEKISIIPNMLSFDLFATKEEILQKQNHKRVLVVSRMEETHKHISQVLKIWELIMKNKDLRNWHLDMVGDGQDINYYKNIVKTREIPNIIFHGLADPITFYKNASFLMMTSEAEGWGLSLTEAQQLGCVPIAFDSYESLHDIITDGKNGFIIPNGDKEKFAKVLSFYMKNPSNLVPLMKNAVESSKRFAKEEIGKLWYNVLTQLS